MTYLERAAGEYRFCAWLGCQSLRLCGLDVSLETPGDSSRGPGRTSEGMNLLLDEIVELYGFSGAAVLQDAGYFLRVRVDAHCIADPVWVAALCRLQREEHCELALQLSVEGALLDPFDERVCFHLAILRTVNVGVVIELSRVLSGADVDALALAGVTGLAGGVDQLCALTSGPLSANVLCDGRDAAIGLSLSAQNVASPRQFDVARALRCAFVSGPLIGEALNGAAALDLARRSAWGASER
jgi:hypothetical protein